MSKVSKIIAGAMLPAMLAMASCGVPSSAGDGPAASQNALPAGEVDAADAFTMEEIARLDEPWALAFVPGTDVLVVTQRRGTMRALDTGTGRSMAISGVPQVAYGGQGGLGDVAFLESERAATVSSRTIYLSYAEQGPAGTRGAAVGRGTLSCEDGAACAIRDFSVIWRQEPKVSGSGHYSHRLAFSPDGKYLFVSSGDRQKGDPAQDTANTLGTIVRLLPDGTAAPGNPLAGNGGESAKIWSWGHRNALGLAFDAQGRLWDLEHGPRGGDELNLVEPNRNYGWPVVSNGNHYGGQHIPNHDTRPEFAAPAISWNPVIAPGDLLFPKGAMFGDLAGKAVATGLSTQALIVVDIAGDKAVETARYSFDNRLRALAEGADGALWVAEDGTNAVLWKLTAKPAP